MYASRNPERRLTAFLLRLLMNPICGTVLALFLLVHYQTEAQSANLAGKEKVSVHAELLQDKVRVGTACTVVLIVSIAEGWHINAASPADEALIGTTVDIEKKDLLDSVSISYPVGIERHFGYTDLPIEVYEGKVSISLTLHVSKNVPPGTYNLPVRVEYQACSESVCLAPASAHVVLPLKVVAASEPVERISR